MRFYCISRTTKETKSAVDGAIARALGRAKTTISRELQRNALPSGGYSPLHAAGAYQFRRRREAILEREAALRLFVGDRLAEGWTPEQISGWLKSGNEPRVRAIGCERICALIYRTGQKLRDQELTLAQHARHGYKTPAKVREEQTMPRIAIDPTFAATLPLAAEQAQPGVSKPCRTTISIRLASCSSTSPGLRRTWRANADAVDAAEGYALPFRTAITRRLRSSPACTFAASWRKRPSAGRSTPPRSRNGW